MITVISRFTEPAPSRPYDPDSSKVNLETKICRHLRNKGWKWSRKAEKWADPKDGTQHSLAAAISIQLNREKRNV